MAPGAVAPGAVAPGAMPPGAVAPGAVAPEEPLGRGRLGGRGSLQSNLEKK